jgi:hypothetical protein
MEEAYISMRLSCLRTSVTLNPGNEIGNLIGAMPQSYALTQMGSDYCSEHGFCGRATKTGQLQPQQLQQLGGGIGQLGEVSRLVVRKQGQAEALLPVTPLQGQTAIAVDPLASPRFLLVGIDRLVGIVSALVGSAVPDVARLAVAGGGIATGRMAFLTVTIDCPGNDSVHIWPLPVVDPWNKDWWESQEGREKV